MQAIWTKRKCILVSAYPNLKPKRRKISDLFFLENRLLHITCTLWGMKHQPSCLTQRLHSSGDLCACLPKNLWDDVAESYQESSHTMEQLSSYLSHITSLCGWYNLHRWIVICNFPMEILRKKYWGHNQDRRLVEFSFHLWKVIVQVHTKHKNNCTIIAAHKICGYS